MPVGHESKVQGRTFNGDGARAVTKRVLVGPEEGWEGWVMRIFTLGPGGYTPLHTHAWPHVNYVIEGSGTLVMGEEEHRIGPGTYAFVPSNIKHQFRNEGDGEFKFICIVPKEGDI